MARSQESMEVGLTKEELISRLGEPDRIEFIKIAFRPPDYGEQRDDYQRALQEWEIETTGELWVYDELELTVRISKAEQVLGWDKGGIKGRPATKSGLVRIEPEAT